MDAVDIGALLPQGGGAACAEGGVTYAVGWVQVGSTWLATALPVVEARLCAVNCQCASASRGSLANCCLTAAVFYEQEVCSV
jgi:hypothetical protein